MFNRGGRFGKSTSASALRDRPASPKQPPPPRSRSRSGALNSPAAPSSANTSGSTDSADPARPPSSRDNSASLADSFRRWRTGQPPGHVRGAGTWAQLGRALGKVRGETPLLAVQWSVRVKSGDEEEDARVDVGRDDGTLAVLWEKGAESLTELSLSVDMVAGDEAVRFAPGALDGLTRLNKLEGLWLYNVEFAVLPDIKITTPLTTLIIHYNEELVQLPVTALQHIETLQRLSIWGCPRFDKKQLGGIAALSTDVDSKQLDIRAAQQWRKAPSRPG